MTDPWKFELYVIGDNRRSALAKENLRGLCKEYLYGHCRVDVYDIKEHPELIAEKKLCVAPTLIRKYPLPERTLIGDLSLTNKVLDGLGIDHDGVKQVRNGTYHDGLNKQGITFKWHHEQSRR